MKIFLFSILLVLSFSCGKSSNGDGLERSVDTLSANQYFELMNNHRMSLGLRPLTYSVIIEEQAGEHSTNMARGLTPFGHFGMSFRCNNLQRSLGSSACGEIVAKGQETASSVLSSWLGSSDHRAEIENPNWTHTGIAVEKGLLGTPYWTQIFIRIN
jgi:uncharacterized protein YkwD